MAIELGSITPNFFRLGNTAVTAIFMADNKVWPISEVVSASFGSGFAGVNFSLVNTSTTASVGSFFYAAGDFQSYRGQEANSFAKIGYDGTYNSQFYLNASQSLARLNRGPDYDQNVWTVAQDTTGNVYLGGERNPFFLKLDSTGSPVPGFTPTDITASIGQLRDMDVLPNGNILLTLDTEAPDTSSLRIMSPNGAVVNAGYVAIGTIIYAGLDTSGKIYIAGTSRYNGQNTPNGLARLQTNLLVDNTFTPAVTASLDAGVTVLANDKLIVQGTDNRLYRLNNAGTVDSSWNISTYNGIIRQVIELSNTRILVVGDFDIVNGSVRRRIALLSTEGLVETGFTSPTTFDGYIDNAFEYLGERVYLFGNFTSYRGVAANNVIRIDLSGNIA